jgi:hypothetical protein
MADQPQTIGTAPMRNRLYAAIYEIRGRSPTSEPAWIILGQQERYALWTEVRRDDPSAALRVFGIDDIPRFHGVPIATVPVAHYFEVTDGQAVVDRSATDRDIMARRIVNWFGEMLRSHPSFRPVMESMSSKALENARAVLVDGMRLVLANGPLPYDRGHSPEWGRFPMTNQPPQDPIQSGPMQWATTLVGRWERELGRIQGTVGDPLGMFCWIHLTQDVKDRMRDDIVALLNQTISREHNTP